MLGAGRAAFLYGNVLWTLAVLNSALVEWWDFSDSSYYVKQSNGNWQSLTNKAPKSNTANIQLMMYQNRSGQGASPYVLGGITWAYGYDTSGTYYNYPNQVWFTGNAISGVWIGFFDTSGGTAYGRMVSHKPQNNPDYNNYNGYTLGRQNANQWYMQCNYPVGDSFAYSNLTPFLAEYELGANVAQTFNNAVAGTRNTSTGITPAFSFFESDLGCRDSASDYWRGAYGEQAVFNRFLTSIERPYVQGATAWKWKQQALLPNSHQFKNAAPTMSDWYRQLGYIEVEEHYFLPQNDNFELSQGGVYMPRFAA